MSIMKKTAFVFVALLLVSFFVQAPKAYAQLDTSGCGSIQINSPDFVPNYILNGSPVSFTFQLSGLTPGKLYNVSIAGDFSSFDKNKSYPFTADQSGSATVKTDLRSAQTSPVEAGFVLFRFSLHRDLNQNGQKLCDLGATVGQNPSDQPAGIQCELRVWQDYTNPTTNKTQACYANSSATACLVRQTDVHVEATIKDSKGVVLANKPVDIQLQPQFSWQGDNTDANGKITETFSGIETGNYTVEVSYDRTGVNNVKCNNIPIKISESCLDKNGQRSCNIDNTPITPPTDVGKTSFNLCNQIPDENLQDQCRVCAVQGEGGADEQGGVWTAVGCISRNPVDIVHRLIQVGLGMGGGVALIMTLAGGFILATSQGEPQKANQAKEMITNSVIGLLFVIFSVVILQFIGVKILNIPGFGST